jgi:hypothetical protein
MNAVAQSEIARYVEAVREALADLSPRERDELLEDLPDHLAEVAAEGQGSLEARLGAPAAYAVELRNSAGLLTPGAAPAEETFQERMTAVADQIGVRLRRLDVRVGPLIGYALASDFLRLLRPAWWVLRGYLAAMMVTWLLDESGRSIGLLPRLGGSEAAALVILAGFIVGSIWLGRRSAGLTGWPRRAFLAGSGLVVLFAVVGFFDADDRSRWSEQPYEPAYGNPYEHIGDVFVYDEHGRLLTNVRLFDQDGQPIQLGSHHYCESGSAVEGSGTETASGAVAPYPRCPQDAPFTVQPTASPEATSEPAPTGEAAPTPTGSPTAGATPTGPPTVAPGVPPATPTPGAAPAAPGAVPEAVPGLAPGAPPAVP